MNNASDRIIQIDGDTYVKLDQALHKRLMKIVHREFDKDDSSARMSQIAGTMLMTSLWIMYGSSPTCPNDVVERIIDDFVRSAKRICYANKPSIHDSPDSLQ